MDVCLNLSCKSITDYTATFFTPFKVKQKPKGLKDFQTWMKRGDFDENENSLAGRINVGLFYQGLKAAGPKFTRQKVVDETTRSPTTRRAVSYRASTRDPPRLLATPTP